MILNYENFGFNSNFYNLVISTLASEEEVRTRVRNVEINN